jgi:diguanylate cyclase (GGDEF)-like protein
MTQLLREKTKDYRVLYVEDDVDVGRTFAGFLENLFAEVVTAVNGKEGLERYREGRFEFVITDINMPVMNGIEMLASIKELNPHQAAIIISAHNDQQWLHEAIRLGVDGFLVKPFMHDASIEVLDKVADKVMAHDQEMRRNEELERLVDLKRKELIEVSSVDTVSGFFNLPRLVHDLEEFESACIVVFKIMGFKKINDYYGYEVGDDLLVQTSNFLKTELQAYFPEVAAHLYRTSGAHFSMLLKMDEADTIVQVAHEIAAAFEKHEFYVDLHYMYFELAVGIAEGSNLNLLARGDTALRMAEQGPDNVVMLSEEAYDTHQNSNFYIERKNMIRRALMEKQIVPYYQPIMHNATNKIAKYEALMRIATPEGRIVPPMEFMFTAKESGLYVHMTRQMLEQVLSDFAPSECSVSLNISVDDISDHTNREFILEKVLEFPEPQRLVFELLESEEIRSFEEVHAFLGELKALGCKIAIDDFGSGYSNFEYLLALNVDFIKFDASLIKEIDTKHDARMIVEMIVDFARKVGISTIAEHVSSKAILEVVKVIGIDQTQGYHVSEPLPFSSQQCLGVTEWKKWS